jgi:hypothetical protein
MTGVIDHEYVLARRVLLDALEALESHRESIILVGAQAIYAHTGDVEMAVAPYTTDADLAIDTRSLGPDPRIEAAMKLGGFVLREEREGKGDPGAWIGPHDVPIDLMAAESGSGGGRRSVKAPPHFKRSMRKVRGLEAALVDKDLHEIVSLEPESDNRKLSIYVAGPAALVVAKSIKIGERKDQQDGRLKPKDALDLFYLLQAKASKEIAERMIRVESEAISSEVTIQALGLLSELFGTPGALGCDMAVEALGPLANPATVRAQLVILTNDVLAEVDKLRPA